MSNIEIKLRKNAVGKTIFLRIFFYTFLLFSSASALFLLNLKYPIDPYSPIYIGYLIALVFLAAYFQYLIYAFSMGKSPTFKGLISTLKNDDIEHPILYLFPEFELFYRLQDSIFDKLDEKKLFENTPEYINENVSLQFENDFKTFIDDNLQELLKYEIVIKIKRKGKAIFDDLVEDCPQLRKLIPFSDPAIIYNVSKIKDRPIIIFDDSIHHGVSASKILDLLKKIGSGKILYLSVVAQKDSLNDLKSKYTERDNIKFLHYKEYNEEDYSNFYSKYMFGYLDHVNRSLENDHTIVKLKINKLIEKEDLLELFNNQKDFKYEIERIVEKDNEYKISVECPRIYEKIKVENVKKLKMDMVKVRFFVRLNQPDGIYPFGTTDINLSPTLVPREFSDNFCKKPESKESCTLLKLKEELPDKNIPEYYLDLACINCIIDNLTDAFLSEFMREFKQKLKKTANAIFLYENTIPPYPQERYPLKNRK